MAKTVRIVRIYLCRLLASAVLILPGFGFVVADPLPVRATEVENLFDGVVLDGLGIAGRPSLNDLNEIAALGIGLVRIDLTWARAERTRGVYDFAPNLELAIAMRAHGIRPMFILDYGNPLYSPVTELTHRGIVERWPAAPATQEAIAAYSAWAVAAVKTFAEFDPVWEIWNEPDVPRFWPPEPDPVAYARLAYSACSAMRAASPSVLTIVGPAVADWIGSDYLDAVLRSEAVTCFDAISVHPYQITAVGDEDTTKWESLRRRIDDAHPDRMLPIANTEWGRSQVGRVTDAQQAAYLVRSLVINQAAGVRLNIWYRWNDRGDTPGNDQHHFGIKRYDGSFRLAHAAMATLTAQIGPARFHCIAYTDGVTRALFVEQGKRETKTLVIWSQSGNRTWFPPEDIQIREAISMTGKTLNSERLSLVSREPVYLKINSASNISLCVE